MRAWVQNALGASIALVVAATAVAEPVSAAEEKRIVLVLESGAAADDVHDNIVNGIRERMSAERSIRLQVEHLDILAHRDERYADRLEQLLHDKYAALPVDVIIAIDEPAMRFALRTRERAFGNPPLVVGEVTALTADELERIPNLTGVLGHHNTEANLRLIMSLNPRLKRVMVVDDAAETTEATRQGLRNVQRRYKDRLELVLLSHQSVEALENLLSDLGPTDAVILLSHYRDDAGREFDRLAMIGQLERATNAPIYGMFEESVGYGIVGGYLRSTHLLGRQLAEMALEILEGRHPDTLPLVAHAPHRYVFDFRQLQRFGYDLSDLPAGSTVIEEPKNFYYLYRHYFWLAVAIFAGMAFYIFQLLLSIQKRKRAQRGLERIVASGERALSLASPEALLEDILERLRAIAPSLQPLGAYRLVAATDAPVRLEQLGDPPAESLPSNMLDTALTTHRTQCRGRDALVYLPDTHLPLSLVGLRAARSLDAIDQRLLDIAARNIAIEYENLEASRVAETLRAASDIQMAMLPRDFDQLARPYGVEVDATLRAAAEVGGDLYDIFALDDERLCLLVGDVSGKGVPAALFMAMSKSVIRAAAETLDTPGAILQKANAVIQRDNHQDMFVTVSLAIYDRRTGVAHCASAGHPHPWCRVDQDNWHRKEVAVGLALGILPQATYPETAVALPPGGALLLYSDGVTEATDADDTLFGDNGMQTALSTLEPADATGVVAGMLNEIDRYAAGEDQADDITLLCVRRNS